MIHEPLIAAVCSDVAGQVRGKSFPAKDRAERLRRGIGWTPTNVQITCFGAIAPSPFGALGDLLLMPDKNAEYRVDFQDGSPAEHFMLSDIVTLDGDPWECCCRGLLRQALAQLRQRAGLTLTAAFEHEFYYTGADNTGSDDPLCNGYRLEAQRSAAEFSGAFTAALRQAGLTPDTFMAEYGPAQFEATVQHTEALGAADQCVALRELARTTARRLGHRVSFAPLITREIVGNGVHIHMSLSDAEDGRPLSYDAEHRYGLSEVAGRFAAGVLRYAPALVAFTAPSVPSYQRLVPHRWSAAYNNLGYRDREACLRVCPVSSLAGDPATQFNLEYRAADATASPHLQLAALIHAGLQGIEDQLPTPQATEQDLSELSADQLAQQHIQALPKSLPEALAIAAREPAVSTWFSELFLDVYQRHKQTEIDSVADLDADALCARYAQVY